MFYGVKVQERCETVRTWFMGRGQRKSPAILTDYRALPKLNSQMEHFSQIMLCVFISLHVVVAQVADQAQLVVFYILYHHILVIKLLDDDFTIISIWMHAADSVV